MVGTRGVPAQYGGFETAVEEIGKRLADAGHDVTVYCRSATDGTDPSTYLGMRRIVLPSLHRKSLETLSHTFLSACDALRRQRFHAVFLFNAANAPFLPIVRRRRTRVAVHLDGLESRRGKWGKVGRKYYRACEALSVRWGDALIADAEAIAQYYADEFGATTEVIAYGAPAIDELGMEGLDEFGVDPGRYHLVVARFEPENHVDIIVRGFRRSEASWPLLVVGGAPYADGYISDVHDAAGGDERIRFLGPVWDQALLDRLYHHAGTYIHGHSVGGTNPSLLRAMGAGTAVLANDVVFAREVLGDTGRYFRDEASLADLLVTVEADGAALAERGSAARRRVTERYRWDDVALQYERLAERLAAGSSRRREVSGRRRPGSPWRGGRLPDPAAIEPSEAGSE
jgi:glycosyltransferase involved in cell wall biosynthesis